VDYRQRFILNSFVPCNFYLYDYNVLDLMSIEFPYKDIKQSLSLDINIQIFFHGFFMCHILEISQGTNRLYDLILYNVL
jgi:hypothetical protein